MRERGGCPWVTDMELIADCRLWFGLATLAVPSAISPDANLMDAAKRRTETEACTHKFIYKRRRRLNKLKRHTVSWQTVISVRNSVPHTHPHTHIQTHTHYEHPLGIKWFSSNEDECPSTYPGKTVALPFFVCYYTSRSPYPSLALTHTLHTHMHNADLLYRPCLSLSFHFALSRCLSRCVCFCFFSLHPACV